jgi:hypothetical protein
MKKTYAMNLSFGLTLMAILMPSALAIGGCEGDYTPSCINSTTLLCEKIWTISGAQYPMNYTVTCPNGCSSYGCLAMDIQQNTVGWAIGMIFICFGIYMGYVAFVEYTRPEELGEEE